MKNGDVIINVDNRIIVTFQGFIGGYISSYNIKYENGWEKFTGTIEDLLEHCAKKIKSHNKHVEEFGGTRI